MMSDRLVGALIFALSAIGLLLYIGLLQISNAVREAEG